jgi:hypothetical protein
MQVELLLVLIPAFIVICKDSMVQTTWDMSQVPDQIPNIFRNPKLEYNDWVWICLSMTEMIGYEVD